MTNNQLPDTAVIYPNPATSSSQDERNLYLVLEHLPGGPLLRHLRERRTFEYADARFYAAQVVMAVQAVHSAGVAHRDLKPESLLLGKDGYLKLAGFGFAKKVRTRIHNASLRASCDCVHRGPTAPPSSDCDSPD